MIDAELIEWTFPILDENSPSSNPRRVLWLGKDEGNQMDLAVRDQDDRSELQVVTAHGKSLEI